MLKPHERDDLLLDMSARLARMEAKQDFLITGHADHETRLRSTERWRWGIPGTFVAALLAFLFQ